MMPFALKVFVSALLIAAAAEVGRRSAVAGALLASLPLTSILALVWLWRDGAPPAQLADFASGVLVFVLPSLLLFIVTPLLLRAGWSFWPSLGAGCAATAAGYALGILALRAWTALR